MGDSGQPACFLEDLADCCPSATSADQVLKGDALTSGQLKASLALYPKQIVPSKCHNHPDEVWAGPNASVGLQQRLTTVRHAFGYPTQQFLDELHLPHRPPVRSIAPEGQRNAAASIG